MGNNKYILLIGKIILAIYLIILVISLFYTPHDPNLINPELKLVAPSWNNIFGTDNFGRDIFSRIVVGTKTAFYISVISVTSSLIIGFIIGVISGYYGGWLDELLMRLIDALMAFPGILFAIMLITVFNSGLITLVVALAIIRLPYFTRVIRGNVIQIKKQDFIVSSIIKGGGPIHILIHHILPNMTNQILIAYTTSFSTVILSEAGLSYLGLGIQPPAASWGRMLKEAQPYFITAPWYSLFTVATITILVFGFTLIGEGLKNDQRK